MPIFSLEPGLQTMEFDAPRWIALEKMRLVWSNLPATLIVTVTCAAILAVMLRYTVPLEVLTAWFTVAVIISVARYRQYVTFRRVPDDAIDVPRWTRKLLAGTAMSGLFWGSAAVILFPPGDLAHQVLLPSSLRDLQPVP